MATTTCKVIDEIADDEAVVCETCVASSDRAVDRAPFAYL